jgi:hypothetical protein
MVNHRTTSPGAAQPIAARRHLNRYKFRFFAALRENFCFARHTREGFKNSFFERRLGGTKPSPSDPPAHLSLGLAIHQQCGIVGTGNETKPRRPSFANLPLA